LGEQTSVGLCAFGGELRCLVPPTREVAALVAGLDAALRFGRASRGQGTRLYTSLVEMATETASAKRPQRALVVFSDGLDNRGGKVKEAIAAAQAADLRVYAVKLGQAFRDPGLMRGLGGPGNRAMYDYRKLDLERLAAETGGESYEPPGLDRKSLSAILREIATEIRMEHVLGYQPQGAPDGKQRRVKVELVDKSLGRIRDGERSFLR
jgi:VWFA-related protein